MKETKQDSSLEDRTVERLITEGLIKRKSGVYRIHWATSMAAALIIFLVGGYAGSTFRKSTAASYNYVLLLHQDSTFDEGDGHFAEYGQWMQGLKTQGVTIGGEKLGDDVFLTDGTTPYDQDRIKMVTGFFMIGVDSKETAMKIAMGSPHVKHGGKIEIREIVNE